MTVNDLIGKGGQYFSAIILDVQCFGKISEDDNYIYLCQNQQSGANTGDLQGYNYSWQLRKSAYSSNEAYNVSDLKIITEGEYNKLAVGTILGTNDDLDPFLGSLDSVDFDGDDDNDDNDDEDLVAHIFGFDVFDEGKNYAFGCGAVTLDKDDVEDFLNISKHVYDKFGFDKLQTFLQTAATFDENIDESELADFESARKQLKLDDNASEDTKS